MKGVRQGAGQIVHAHHRFVGNFLDDQPQGPGKYVFGKWEQRGEYTVDKTAQAEDDDKPNKGTAKWSIAA